MDFRVFGSGDPGSAPSSSLPVELLSFTGEEINSKAHLFWETASEINNKGFEVQHSANGIEFNKIGWIDGNGTTNELQSYNFKHTEMHTGKNYYKLKQIDFNGDFEFSKIISLSLDNEGIPTDLSFYPNPTSDFIQIHNLNSSDIVIFDSAGKIVFQKSYNEVNPILKINISHLQSGIYFMKDKENFKKIVKK